MDYVRIYSSLTERARGRSRDIFEEPMHNHHILPRWMGGDDSPSNLVLLTVKEHYVVHHLLARINPNEPKARAIGYILAAQYRTIKNLGPLKKQPKTAQERKTYKYNLVREFKVYRYGRFVGRLSVEDRREAVKTFASMAKLNTEK